MIGACPPAFQASSAARMSGSSGPTSSAVDAGASDGRSTALSLTSVARTSSPLGMGGGVVGAHAARVTPEPPITISVTKKRIRIVDMTAELLQLLRPAKVGDVQAE